MAIQRDLVIIPQSTNPPQIRSNADLDDFELGTVELETLDGLDEALVTGWSPDDTP